MSSPFVPRGLALVLSGGGARASYQVGVLAAIADRVADLSFPILTGVSAGAINTAYLAAYRGPMARGVRALLGEWLRISPDRVYHVPTVRLARWLTRFVAQFTLGRFRGMGTVRGVLDMRPLSRFLGGIIDFDGIDANIAAGLLDAVALTATSYTTGQAVTFVQGRPEVPLWERHQRVAVRARLTLSHVMASSAIPLIFPAVKLNGAFYGDGSVRQGAPFAPAIHLGARRILAISNRTARAQPNAPDNAEYPTTAQVVALLFNAVFVDSLDADAERLERINHLVAALRPDAPVSSALDRVRLLMLRPSRDVSDLTEGLRPRLPGVLDRIVRNMGAEAEGAQDFLSYLMFDPSYTGPLMEMGYEDAVAQWSTIERFLAEES